MKILLLGVWERDHGPDIETWQHQVPGRLHEAQSEGGRHERRVRREVESTHCHRRGRSEETSQQGNQESQSIGRPRSELEGDVA